MSKSNKRRIKYYDELIFIDFYGITDIIDKELAGSEKFTVKNLRNIQKVMDKHFEKELKLKK